MSPDHLFDKAFHAHIHGDLETAAQQYKQILNIWPNHSDSLHHLGLVHLQWGSVSKAIDWIHQSIQANSQQPNALSNLGNCLNMVGRYQEALKFCGQAIQQDARNHGAWTNLGNAQQELGLITDAENSYRNALDIQPTNSRYNYNLANILFIQCKYKDSEILFERSIALDGKIPEAHNNYAGCLIKLEKYSLALVHATQATQLKPDYAQAWLLRGHALGAMNRNDEALKSFEHAVNLNPTLSEAWMFQGQQLSAVERYDEALASFKRAIELKENCAETWFLYGNTLSAMRRYDQALTSLQYAVELKPDTADAWNNCGNALCNLKRHNEALAYYERAIVLNPEDASVWSNQGVALDTLGRYEEALSSHKHAAALNPDYIDAWTNQGATLVNLQRQEEALECYDFALALDSEQPEALYNKGILKLSQRNFIEGFKAYRTRWGTDSFPDKPLQTHLPLCSPESVVNAPLFLWAEQGLGDEIFYSSMLSVAETHFPRITLSADKRLHPIFERSFPNIKLVDRKLPFSAIDSTGFKAQAPIGDLGFILQLDSEKIAGSRRPFLAPNADRTRDLRTRHPFDSEKKVLGISWKSINNSFGNSKSIKLECLAPIFENQNISFLNLQYGDVDNEIKFFEKTFEKKLYQFLDIDLFNDIDSLLSLIDACDYVVTTSNVTAHLAGSIGKPGCILVPYSKGRIWYWHQDDSYSFWYPSLKIFYQDKTDSWTDTVLKASYWLKETFDE